MRTSIGGRFIALTLAVVTVSASGCASMNRQEEGAVIGAAAGGALGGIIAGSTAKGVIVGAVLGGAAGAVIGNEMDKKAEAMEGELDNAEVERVGEGILVTFASGILFDFDSSTLRSEARANLADLARVLGEDTEDFELLVAGHTDSVGADDYNQSLSERRARSAANYLMSQGVPPSKITTMGLGEAEPVASNDSEVGQQENRRVEVAIYASESYQEEVRRRHGG